jgi:choice-of-anchor B domain-containing protein
MQIARPLLFLLTLTTTAQAQLNLQLLAHMPNDSGVTLAGCWHYVDSAANEYALIGNRVGLDIVDVSVPTAPVRRFRVPGLINNWREVKVWNGFAYVGSEATGSGITIVDLRSLPDTVYYKVFTGEGLLDSLVLRSHTVGAVDGYLYVYGNNTSGSVSGANIFSLQDPWNPVFMGNYAGNYLHDGFVRGDTLWGSEIYQGQFSVVDISDRTNPVLLATHPTPGKFNHNTELSKTGQFLFAADEVPSAPLAAFDVSDLSNITLTDIYLCSQKPAGEVHNVRHFGDDYLICPSYQGQLTIVDASDPYNLIETAWANLGTSLVWDANPYLPSGIVFATAKNEGLYIYQPTYVRAGRLTGTVRDASTGLPLLNAKVFVEGTPNADTTDINGYYATGAALASTYTIRAERQGYFTQTLSQSLANGQQATLDINLVPEPVSSQEDVADVAVQVFPTVNNGTFHVRLAPQLASKKPLMRIFDATGRQVWQQKAAGTEHDLNLSLAPGAYRLVVGGLVCSVVVR